MADLRRQMIAEGVPPVVVEATIRYSECMQLAQLERDLPLMLRDMKITNGETMLQ